MKKDRVEWPEDVNEARETRRDRMAILVSLNRKDLDYVNRMLCDGVRDRTVFNLITLLETTHPAKSHIEKWQPAFDVLMEKLAEEDYSDVLIDHVKKTLA